jgi:hypothetical protein
MFTNGVADNEKFCFYSFGKFEFIKLSDESGAVSEPEEN